MSDGLHVLIGLRSREDIPHGASDDGLRSAAELLGAEAVDEMVDALSVDGEDGGMGVFDEGAILFFTLSQGELDLLVGEGVGEGIGDHA